MRIYLRHERYAQRVADIAKVVSIVAAAGVEREQPKAKTQRYRNTAADARVLRMIPVVAEGVVGTVPGTDPLGEYLRLEAQAIRHGIR